MNATARPQLTRDEMIRRIVDSAPPASPTQIEIVRRLMPPVTKQASPSAPAPVGAVLAVHSARSARAARRLPRRAPVSRATG